MRVSADNTPGNESFRQWLPPFRPKRATLYRMVMPQHVCPYGLKAKDLLERQGSRSRTLAHHLATD